MKEESTFCVQILSVICRRGVCKCATLSEVRQGIVQNLPFLVNNTHRLKDALEVQGILLSYMMVDPSIFCRIHMCGKSITCISRGTEAPYHMGVCFNMFSLCFGKFVAAQGLYYEL